MPDYILRYMQFTLKSLIVSVSEGRIWYEIFHLQNSVYTVGSKENTLQRVC